MASKMADEDLRDDLYELLGLEAGADEKEVARAYRKKSLKHHPDRGGDVKKFHEIKHARDVLMDPKKKEEYDKRMSRNAMARKRQREREAELSSKRRRDRDDLFRREKEAEAQREQSRGTQHRSSHLERMREGIKARQEEMAAEMARARHRRHEHAQTEHEQDRPARTVTFKWDRKQFSHSDDSIIAALRSYGEIELVKMKTASAKVVFASKVAASNAVRVEAHKPIWRSVRLQSHLVDLDDSAATTDENTTSSDVPCLPDGPISLEEHLAFEQKVLARLRQQRPVPAQ